MDFSIKTLDQLRPILRGFRKTHGLTQKALAAKLGISQQSYAELEANPASATLNRLIPVLRLLGVELIFRQTHDASADPSSDGEPPIEEAAIHATRPAMQNRDAEMPLYLRIQKTHKEFW